MGMDPGMQWDSQTCLDQGPGGSSQVLCKALPSRGTRRGLNFLVKEVCVRREVRRTATGLVGLGVEGTEGRWARFRLRWPHGQAGVDLDWKGSPATPESSKTGGESSLLPEGRGPPGKAWASNLLPLQHIIVTGGQVAASAVAAGRSSPRINKYQPQKSQGLTLRSGEGHRLALSTDGELSRHQPDTGVGAQTVVCSNQSPAFLDLLRICGTKDALSATDPEQTLHLHPIIVRWGSFCCPHFSILWASKALGPRASQLVVLGQHP